jgi:CubicO group peptidase (beta-lactamase class C family)
MTSLQAQTKSKATLSFEDKVMDWLTENNVPAVGIGIIEDGKIKYVKVLGELKKGVPAPDNTIFSIASMTKPVVTMLTLKLVEAGKWNLDEPLFHYWVDPDIADDPLHKKLTTRHVLTHQTGFVNWRGEHPTKKLTFDFEPGTSYQYSGEGFEYLRRALEHKYRQSLAQLSDSLLFKPLGMKDTRYIWDVNKDKSRFACWHDSKGNICKPSTPEGFGVNAAGGLLTTIEDFCKFSIDVINGANLSTDIYNDMIQPHVKLKEHFARGLGWEVITDLPEGEYALEHSGSSGGVQTIFVLLPKSRRGIIVLTNGDNGMFVYNHVIRELIDIGNNVLNTMKGTEHKMVVLPDEVLDRYLGNYLDSRGRPLTVTKADSVLKMSGNGIPTVELCPETEKKFFIKDFDVQIEFINDDSLVLTAYGKIDFTACKIKHPQIIELSDDILEKYVGTYVRLDNNSDIYVKKENAILKLSGETVLPMDLYPVAENKFFVEEYGFQFEFIKDTSGKVIKMNVIGNGKILCETKRIN